MDIDGIDIQKRNANHAVSMATNQLKLKGLISKNDPRLKEESEPFDFDNPPCDPHDLIDEMKRILIEEDGLGLSAVQVGMPYRVFLVGNAREPATIMSFFNPVITAYLGTEYVAEEGCLTFPGLYIKIKRNQSIRARYQNVHGEINTDRFTGYTARCFQHEFDHLDGILFMNRASRFHLEQALNQKKRRDRRKKANERRSQFRGAPT